MAELFVHVGKSRDLGPEAGSEFFRMWLGFEPSNFSMALGLPYSPWNRSLEMWLCRAWENFIHMQISTIFQFPGRSCSYTGLGMCVRVCLCVNTQNSLDLVLLYKSQEIWVLVFTSHVTLDKSYNFSLLNFLICNLEILSHLLHCEVLGKYLWKLF